MSESRRPPRWWSMVTVVIVTLTVLGSVAGTDDHWPFAPFRMFSYGNNPNGVVRRMVVELHTPYRFVRVGADSFGLRRSEIEEQTPWNRRIPDERIADLARAYNRTHRHKAVHLQLLVLTTQMRNGEKAGDETKEIIGDWADPSWTGERAVIDRPLADPWPGYTE